MAVRGIFILQFEVCLGNSEVGTVVYLEIVKSPKDVFITQDSGFIMMGAQIEVRDKELMHGKFALAEGDHPDGLIDHDSRGSYGQHLLETLDCLADKSGITIVGSALFVIRHSDLKVGIGNVGARGVELDKLLVIGNGLRVFLQLIVAVREVKGNA